MTIATEMDSAIVVLALAAAHAGEPALRAQIEASIERFEELRMDVMALEALALPPRLPQGWQPQREATVEDLQGGRVVSLDMARQRARA
jgi:hypothetical protein